MQRWFKEGLLAWSRTRINMLGWPPKHFPMLSSCFEDKEAAFFTAPLDVGIHLRPNQVLKRHRAATLMSRVAT